MLRLPHQFAAAYAASQLQWLSCFRLLHTNPEKASSTAVPEQWLSDFNPTEPLPPGYSSDTTAFGWARKQAPQLSLAQLGKLFRQRQVRVVQQGQADLPVRQSGTLRNRMLLGNAAMPALTRYKVLASRDGLAWLELAPLTNRPNQLRLHCGKLLAAPIVGDYKYGYRPWAAAAPTAKPWLSKYLAKAADTGTSSSGSSSSRFSKPSWAAAEDEQDDEEEESFDAAADGKSTDAAYWPESGRGLHASSAAAAGAAAGYSRCPEQERSKITKAKEKTTMSNASRASGIDGLSAVQLRPNSHPGQDPGAQAGTTGVPAASKVKMPSEAQQASFWDQQIANGNLSMCSVKYPTYVNVMLYGESGLGKTTSIMNLIGSWGIKRAGAAFKKAFASAACKGPGSSGVGESGKTSLELFKADPDSLKVELEPLLDDTSNLEMHFSFQDMPGWGDDINLVNSLKTVLDFLLKQRQKDYIRNKAGLTEHCAVPGTMMRHGITVCLYFVPPHRVKPIDWIMMAAISKLVAVIPVIAKADTFTAQEMEDFRQELLQVIQHQQAGVACSSNSSSPATSSPPTPNANTPPAPGTAATSPDASESSAASSSSSSSTPIGLPRSAAAALSGSAARLAAVTAAAPGAGGGKVVSLPLGSKLLGEGDIRDYCASMMAEVVHKVNSSKPAAPDSSAAAAAGPVAVVVRASQSTEHAGAAGAKAVEEDPVGLASQLCLETYRFRESDLEMVGASTSQLPPFAIVASKDLMGLEDVTAADGGQVGQPFRRYRWGSAFPLNRDHSDLIILKQLLFGHRNFAVHDLLQDSWRRAFTFAREYETLLRDNGHELASATTALLSVSLAPMVDALCSSTCGSTELADKLRSEEAKEVITNLERAREQLERSAAVERKLSHKLDKAKTEAEGLRGKLAEQASVITRLLSEIEVAKAPTKKKWRLGGGN
ncbi:hypothetical protein OEZ86_005472 [Tetradesmus obliquus]|nr:hypothetical protein OEZ86_005472 [Tetradesmus obliquus]